MPWPETNLEVRLQSVSALPDGERHRLHVSGSGVEVTVTVDVSGSALSSGEDEKQPAIEQLILNEIGKHEAGPEALRMLEQQSRAEPLKLDSLNT